MHKSEEKKYLAMQGNMVTVTFLRLGNVLRSTWNVRILYIQNVQSSLILVEKRNSVETPEVQSDGPYPSLRIGDLPFYFHAFCGGNEVAHLAPRPVALQPHGHAVALVRLQRHVLLELHYRAVAGRAPDHAPVAVLDGDGRRARGRVDALALQLAHEQRVGGAQVHDEDLLLRVVDEDAAAGALARAGEGGRRAEGDAAQEAVHVAQALVPRRAAYGGQRHVHELFDVH